MTVLIRFTTVPPRNGNIDGSIHIVTGKLAFNNGLLKRTVIVGHAGVVSLRMAESRIWSYFIAGLLRYPAADSQ